MPEDALLMREIHVAKDRKTALQECRDALAFRFNVYVQPSQDKEMPGGDDDDFDLHVGALANVRLIIGCPDECIEELHRYAALGFNYTMFDYHMAGLDDSRALKNLKWCASSAPRSTPLLIPVPTGERGFSRARAIAER
jgi:alkanesulfonate monooxygenase SsuD/methylene tetrahydromethanopterin reductase-like flavin-dependent oxidoreductase (luciferase family)